MIDSPWAHRSEKRGRVGIGGRFSPGIRNTLPAHSWRSGAEPSGKEPSRKSKPRIAMDEATTVEAVIDLDAVRSNASLARTPPLNNDVARKIAQDP